MKMKKLISFLLAAAMTVSVAFPSATVAFAQDNVMDASSNMVMNLEDLESEPVSDEVSEPASVETSEPASDEASEPASDEVSEPASDEASEPASDEASEPASDEASESVVGEDETEASAVEQTAKLFEALPLADAVASMTEEEVEQASAAVGKALDALNALTAEEMDLFTEKYEALYLSVVEDLIPALEEAANNPTEDLSLRPMPETEDIYITLNGYTKDQLKKFPVDEMVNRMTDRLGQKIEVDPNYTHVWVYFSREGFDDVYELNKGDTIDLWAYYYSQTIESITTDYTVYIVLSNGAQLTDTNCHRYIVTVELNTMNTVWGEFDYTLIDESGKNVYSSQMDVRTGNKNLGALGMRVDSHVVYTEGYQVGENYRLKMDGMDELLRQGIQVDVYPMANFLAYRDQGQELTGSLNDQIFTDTGYGANFDTELNADNASAADNMLCFVFSNADNGRVIGTVGLGIQLKPFVERTSLTLWSYENGSMKQLDKEDCYIYQNRLEVQIFPQETDGVVISDVGYIGSVSLRLPEGYQLEGRTYYATLSSDHDKITKVYEGYQRTLELAQTSGAKDVTEQILTSSDNAPYGYTFKGTKDTFNTEFSIFTESGDRLGVMMNVREESAPSLQDPDISFDIRSVNYNGRYLSSYTADMVSGVQLDTYYRIDDKYDVGGYQMVFINEELTDQELRKLVPTFYVPNGFTVNSGGRVESGVTSLEHVLWSKDAANTVAYQVQNSGKEVRNYQVTFVAKKTEPTLFVAGPDKRFVNLTADNYFVHDILVANVGSSELTGLKVELINPVNVKLDDYWTVGGEGNDTLPAFDSTSPIYKTEDETGSNGEYNRYATLANIGKIRLLADGEGKISGTLRITAANGQSRDIELTGIAANPHIVSANLDDAVMYVPYSYMVVTDNMYKWNRTTFKLIDGKLPEGMKLYENTGEIYGTPTESGEFTFTVQADYSSSRFSPSTATYTLKVLDNSNIDVYNQTDEGYEIEMHLGVEQGEGTRDFWIEDPSKDQLFVSSGEFVEFVNLWLNGEYLIPGVDYTAESGSTRITIKSQTFQNKALQEGYNTIAAEFRVDGDYQNELKRTAQNFRLSDIKNEGGSGNGGSNANTNNGASGSTTGDATANPQAQSLNLRFHLADAQGNPMTGMTVELHSSPRTAVSDERGNVYFSNVEFGTHTLTVKDQAGNTLGSRQFVLAAGSSGINGNTLTGAAGGTLLVNVQIADGVLSFVSVIPQTGDEFNLKFWCAVLAISAGAVLGLSVYKKKIQYMH